MRCSPRSVRMATCTSQATDIPVWVVSTSSRPWRIANGDLYFSSDGHPGMGGLDIFKATPDSLQGWIVENQQYPLNSSADDFGMTFDGIHNRGYFSSSRGDVNKGWENIYSFECPEILQTVTGWLYERDGFELPTALVYVVGNDGTNEKLSVRGDGSFTMVLNPGVDYVFLGTCKGYLNVKQELSVEPSNESVEYIMQFPLPPINVPVLINNIFYEFDRATLTEESTTALDSLVVMMNDNPSITIELAAHCDYKGEDAYNERLSQRRAESVVNYLIAHGIKADRLIPVGYGESRPKIVRKRLADTHSFLHEGDTLTEDYILKLKDDEQEICNAINRRTEFRVLRTTYGTTIQETVTETPKEEPAATPAEEAAEPESTPVEEQQADTEPVKEPEPAKEPAKTQTPARTQTPTRTQTPVKTDPKKDREPELEITDEDEPD